MPTKEWFDYTADELENDKAKQIQVFEQMLRRLENDGHCRRVFHYLAWVLFIDSLEQ